MSAFYSKKSSVTGEKSLQVLNLNKKFKATEAIEKIKEVSKQRPFKESVETVIRLNVDPKQGDQNIRGTCVLPAGIGKKIRVCVFADKETQDEVMAAGADFFGTDELLKKIAEGQPVEFDKLIATPD